jgi:3-deoxy-7-phosphoheptulonate synthase
MRLAIRSASTALEKQSIVNWSSRTKTKRRGGFSPSVRRFGSAIVASSVTLQPRLSAARSSLHGVKRKAPFAPEGNPRGCAIAGLAPCIACRIDTAPERYQEAAMTAATAKGWTKTDWRAKPRIQMPDYPDQGALNGVEAQLSKYPPLVFAGEARRLKAELAAASRGRAFLLQGGDCAESFAEFSADTIRDTFKVMLQMAMVLTYGAKVPVVKVGRMAGQFAKPRSAPTEMVGGVEMPSYRGDIINDIAPTMEARVPDPAQDAAGLHPGRRLAEPAARVLDGRFRRHPPVHSWTLGFTDHDDGRTLPRHGQPDPGHARFHDRRRSDRETNHELQHGRFLHQPRGAAAGIRRGADRLDSTSGKWLAGSGHMIWIGDRTRQPDGAHVEFAAAC